MVYVYFRYLYYAVLGRIVVEDRVVDIGDNFSRGFLRLRLMGGNCFNYFCEDGNNAVDTVILNSFYLLILLTEVRFFIRS